MNVFDLSAKITMDVNGYLKGLDTAKAVTISTMGVIGGVVSDFMMDSVNVGKDFDTSMSQVAATMGGTMSDLETQVGSVDTAFGTFSGNLREYAQFMGQNTAKSATECAEALNYMALAGYDTETSMKMLPNVLSLSSAGAMDLARASDMVTDTQTAFGISLERTSQMVDEMAKAASTGNTSVEQLGDAFLVVGGLAKELNGGMIELSDGTMAEVDGVQELEIALTAMANAGVKGSEAGTHMRNMLLKLSSPTDDGAAQMKALGVNIFDAEGKMRSLKDIMGDFSVALGRLTQEDKINAISDLFNTRDMAAAEALLGAIEQDWDAIGESILDAEGAAQKMADVQLDNLEGDITLFNSALEGLQIALSDSATPALRELTQFGTETIQNLTDAFLSLPEPLQTTIGMIGLIGGKALEVTPQVIGLASQISILAENCEPVKTAISKLSGLLTNPATWAIGGAVAGVLLVLQEVKRRVDENTEGIRNFRDAAKASREAVHETAEKIKEMSANGIDLANAEERLIEAQNNLNELRDNSIENTTELADAENEYKESVDASNDALEYAKTHLTDFGGIDAAINLLTAVETLKTANEAYVEGTEDVIQKQYELEAAWNRAENLESMYTLLTSDMTAAQQEQAAAILDKLSVVNTEPEAYQNVCNAIEQVTTAYNNEHDALIEHLDTVSNAMDELVAEYDETYNAAYETLTGQFGLFAELPEIVTQSEFDTIKALNEGNKEFNEAAYEVGKSVSDIIDSLDEQIKYMDEYAANIDKATELGIDKGLLARLNDGSKESAAILKAIVEDGGQNIDELNEKFLAVEEGKEGFAGKVAEMETEFSTRMAMLQADFENTVMQLDMSQQAYYAGMNTIVGVIQGSNSMSIYLQNTYAKLAQQAMDAYMGQLGINPPPKVFKEYGKNTVLGAILGVENESRNLERAYATLATTAIDAYEAEMHDVSFEQPGMSGWSRPDQIAASIPKEPAQKEQAPTYLVLDGQIIGRVLNPYITEEQQRIGVQIAGGIA